MKTYKKKGALSLSVNAIVVLVLAITMLGLGIAFTRNMLGGVAGQLKVDFENIPDPTYDNPISFENTRINVRAGSEEVFGFKALNTLSGKATNLTVLSSCGGNILENIANVTTDNNYEIATDIEAGEVVEHAIIINAVSDDRINLCDFVVEFNRGSATEIETKRTRLNLQIIIE